jgi:hypothetical protein
MANYDLSRTPVNRTALGLPSDLGTSRRTLGTSFTLVANANTNVPLPNVTATTVHVAHTNNQYVTINTAGLYLLEGLVAISNNLAGMPSAFIYADNNPASGERFNTQGGTYCQTGGYPNLCVSAVVQLAAGRQISLGAISNVAHQVYGLTSHLSVTLLRSS